MGYVSIWVDICGHLTDEQFQAAMKHHFNSDDGRYPLTPVLLLAAYRHYKTENYRPPPPPPERVFTPEEQARADKARERCLAQVLGKIGRMPKDDSN